MVCKELAMAEEVVGEPWYADTPLRKDEERRAAQVEIGAIVALSDVDVSAVGRAERLRVSV